MHIKILEPFAGRIGGVHVGYKLGAIYEVPDLLEYRQWEARGLLAILNTDEQGQAVTPPPSGLEIVYYPEQPILSILTPTTPDRAWFLQRLANILAPQMEGHWCDWQVLYDNGENLVGIKRNELLAQARGEYVVYIDDDDIVPDDYVGAIVYEARRHKWDKSTRPDAITYYSKRFADGIYTGISEYSLKYKRWNDGPGGVDLICDGNRTSYPRLYERPPCHITPIRREIAQQVAFPEWETGEDRKWAEDLRPMIKTESFIPRNMYTYEFMTNGYRQKFLAGQRVEEEKRAALQTPQEAESPTAGKDGAKGAKGKGKPKGELGSPVVVEDGRWIDTIGESGEGK